MSEMLRVLIVEDSEDDALLMIRRLRQGGYEPSFERVETAEAMQAALLNKPWDLVLCDFKLPQFTGLEALSLLKETGLDIPFIIVSGTIGEETAVEAMKAGAQDYLMKGKLERLTPAIERELKEAAVRRERRQTEEELRNSEEKYRLLVENLNDVVFTVDVEGLITYISPVVEGVTGYAPEEVVGQPFTRFVYPEDLQGLMTSFAHTLAGNLEPLEFRVTGKGGKVQHVRSSSRPLVADGRVVGLTGLLTDITERKQTEERLRILAELLDISPVSVTVHDFQGNFLYVNQETFKLHGYSREEFLALNLHHIDVPESEEIIESRMKAIMEKGEATFEVAHQRKDGTSFPLEVRVRLAKWEDQPVLLSMAMDITERKRAVEALRESEERYRHLFENAQVGLFRSRLSDGRITACNDRFARGTGYDTVRECCADYVTEEHYVDPSTRDIVLKELSEKGQVDDHEMRVRKKDGTPIWVRFSGKVYPEEGFLEGAVVDITDRKLAESALRESEHKFQSLYESMTELMAVHEIVRDDSGKPIDYRILDCNLAYTRITGIPKDKAVGALASELYGTGDAPFLDVYARVAETGVPNRFEAYFEPMDRYFAISVFSPGKGRFATVANDITERRQFELALQVSEEKYRLLVENANDAIFIAQDGKIPFANPMTETLSGYRAEELREIPFADIIHPEDRAMVLDRHRRRLEGEAVPSTYTYRIIRKDGTELSVMLNTVLVDWEGRPATLNFLRDMTDKARLEEQLQQAQKMEAIGTLAGGIAHDFNNILGIIMGCTELALLDVPEGSTPGRHLREVYKAGERAKDLVKQILAFSRRGEQVKKALDPSLIAKEAMKMLRSSLPATIQIQQDIRRDCGTVLADPTQLHQVLMNLCVNAAHAMREGGGILTVRLIGVDLQPAEAATLQDVSPGRYCKLTVRDTGHGMERAVLERIFDPYFTTKGPGEGTGLGLAVVHGLVKSHGGAIRVESQPGRGSTFQVFLPRIDEATPVGALEDLAEIPRGSERILFVDDEKSLVVAVTGMLESLGYRVTPRTSSLEALETFRAQPDQFDLVVTDMTMPYMTGGDLSRRILEIRPDAPIILCTGYSEVMTKEKAKELGIREFVMKPIVMRDMARRIRMALGD